MRPSWGLSRLDLQGQCFFHVCGFAQGGGQLQAQTTQPTVHRQLGLTLVPGQAGAVIGGAAGVPGQQVQWGDVVCRLQARRAHPALRLEGHPGGRWGCGTVVRVRCLHAAVDHGRPAQQGGLQLANLKTAFVELQRAAQLVQPGCARQHAQVVAIELHTALNPRALQVQQRKLQRKACEQGAAGLSGLQRA